MVRDETFGVGGGGRPKLLEIHSTIIVNFSILLLFFFTIVYTRISHLKCPTLSSISTSLLVMPQLGG